MRYDIRIKTKDKIIYANYDKDNKSFNGYVITPTKIEILKEDITDYLKDLLLSDNKNYLGNKDNIEYYEDLNTNFIFPYKENKICTDLFLELNATVVNPLYFANYQNSQSNRYNFKLKDKILTITASFLVMLQIGQMLDIKPETVVNQITNNISTVSTSLNNNSLDNIDELKINFDGINTEDLHNAIYECEGLTSEEKDLLYNEDYFNLIVPYLNNDKLNANEIYFLLSNLNIEFTETEFGGYVIVGEPTIYVNKDYTDNDLIKSVKIHEFIHQTQVHSNYSVIIEGADELIGKEFYNKEIDNKARNIRIVKKLINLLGSDTMLKLVYSDDIQNFVNELSKYLNNEDVEQLTNLLSVHSTKINDEIYDNIDNLISKLYYNMNNTDINLDEQINKIDSYTDYCSLYFNTSAKIREINIEEAMENDLVTITEGFAMVLYDENNEIYVPDENDYVAKEVNLPDGSKIFYSKILKTMDEVNEELSDGRIINVISKSSNISVYKDDNYNPHIFLLEKVEEKDMSY